MLRRLGFFETYCKELYEKCYADGSVVTAVECDGTVAADRLEVGLLVVQARHPLLQACLNSTGDADAFDLSRYQALSPSEQRKALPLKVIHDPHWDLETSVTQAMAEAVGDVAPYLWRFVLILGERRHLLILLSRHEVSDATATLNLMQEICVAYEDGISDIAGQSGDILPPVEDLVRHGPVHASTIEGASHLPFEVFEIPANRRSVFLARQISASKMSAVLGACKSEKVSVNSLIGAVLVLAVAEYFESQGVDVKTLGMHTAISLRHYCQPPPDPAAFGTYVMVVPQPIGGINEANGPWALAAGYGRALKATIHDWAENGFFECPLPPKAVISKMVQSDINTLGEERAFRGPILSNMGLVSFRESFKHFKVTSVYFNSKQVLGDYCVNLSALNVAGSLFCSFVGPTPLISEQGLVAIADAFVLRMLNVANSK